MNVVFGTDVPGFDGKTARLPLPSRAHVAQGGRDHPRLCGFHRPDGLRARRQIARGPGPGGRRRARGLRRGRARAGRGGWRVAHARRRQEPHREARERLRAAARRATSTASTPRSHEALALIAREKLTGQKPPRGANGIVEVWRPWIEDKAGPPLERMEGAVDDQAAFAKLTRDVLIALELMEGPTEQSQEQNNQDDSDSQEAQPQGARGAKRGAWPAERRRSGRSGCVRRPRGRRARGMSGEGLQSRWGGRRGRAAAAAAPAEHVRARCARGFRLSRLHAAFRRGRGRGNLVRRGRAGPAARLPRQAAFAFARRGQPAREPAAAAPARAAKPGVGVRSRRRRPGRRAAIPRRYRSVSAPILQDGARHRPSATRW